MVHACRCLLISMALLAATAGTAVAGKGKPPAAPPAHKPAMPKPPPVHKPPHLPRMPVPHAPHGAPHHLPVSRVTHHPRPMVIHHAVQHVRRRGTPIVRQPLRVAATRTIHRYPVHRVPYRFARRGYYRGYYGLYGYNNYYYPGRSWWWQSYYNRGYGSFHRHRRHYVGGIVESVGNGNLVMRVFRRRSSRFRWGGFAAASSAATSLRNFSLNNGTLFEVMTTPLRGGTLADLQRGAHVMVLPHAHTANLAQTIRVSPRIRR